MASNSDSPLDPIFLSNLMTRLQLRLPLLDTNSFLSHSLNDLLLHDSISDADDVDDDDDEDEDLDLADDSKHRRLIAKEEAKLEKEIVRIVHSGNAEEALKPNSGQSVTIGDHSVCVGTQEEPGSEYRVWEWHGHLMVFDVEEGFSAEYIYGNYLERLLADKKKKDEIGGHSGLRDLIGDGRSSVGGGNGRVLHRSSLNDGHSAE